MLDLSHSLNQRTEFAQDGADTANISPTDQESRSKLALDVLNPDYSRSSVLAAAFPVKPLTTG